ncbi:MAG: alpha/beta fold hydrolase [Leptospira sp.]|nr:alpha/beta fold hydrolase [Leptospira sp.]
MKKSHKITLGLIVLILILSFIPWYFSSLVLYPAVNCNKDHHVFCDTPKELNLEYETVKIHTPSGLTLESWFIPAKGSKKVIIFVHGHGGSRNEGLRFAPVLNKAGFNLLALSLRRNSGSFASMGYYETSDVVSAIDYLLNEKKMDSIGLFGFSMGAATSILTMEKDKRVKAGLFSSGYASAMDVMSESAKRDFGIPYYPLIPIVQFVLNMRGSMEIETVIPEQKIGNISPRPISIFHCDHDDYVDSKHADRLFSAAKEPKEIWIPVCSRHERIWNTNKDEAEKRSVSFFKRYL